ncbi:hypothetical protein [Chryseobacterium turcicum]|uniref:Uncharacterized protein n=1 Tax=Chryseobacterium turcicum TaxID=2898076 RepID=A0A9Q3V3H6_9FLAO|nr:hypothetical protein [Chryseobacterium turcicum]MCD1117467.1 hypothetical protein [Chryseobacterium turcicum]
MLQQSIFEVGTIWLQLSGCDSFQSDILVLYKDFKLCRMFTFADTELTMTPTELKYTKLLDTIGSTI